MPVRVAVTQRETKGISGLLSRVYINTTGAVYNAVIPSYMRASALPRDAGGHAPQRGVGTQPGADCSTGPLRHFRHRRNPAIGFEGCPNGGLDCSGREKSVANEN